MAGIREKKIYCGEKYLEVDIIPYSVFKTRKNTRSKKKKESLLSQKNINTKNAKRKLIQILEANFNENDYHVTLTYDDNHLPKTLEEAQREVTNYIRRLKRKRKKENLEDLKYILITAFTPIKNIDAEEEMLDKDIEIVRAHHHIIINSGLDRDIVEDLWSKKKKSIGIVNARRLQPDKNTGLAALGGYMMKQPSNKRRWTCSQNLIRPESRTNDHKYSRKKVLSAVGNNKNLSYWESQYPGYYIADKETGYEEVFNDLTGMWSIYLKLRKIE